MTASFTFGQQEVGRKEELRDRCIDQRCSAHLETVAAGCNNDGSPPDADEGPHDMPNGGTFAKERPRNQQDNARLHRCKHAENSNGSLVDGQEHEYQIDSEGSSSQDSVAHTFPCRLDAPKHREHEKNRHRQPEAIQDRDNSWSGDELGNRRPESPHEDHECERRS